MKSRPIVAVVTGGYSSEIVVSLKSAEGIRSFLGTRYETYTAVIAADRWYVRLDDGKEAAIDKNDFSFTAPDGRHIKFGFAYITIHGTPGENGLLQGYLDMLRIPYSCCGVLAAALTFNKRTCNSFLEHAGIKIAPSILLRKGEPLSPEAIVARLGLPLFVKPNDGGSSFGVSKVTSADSLEKAIAVALGEGSEALVEQFMPGTEVTCGCYRVRDRKIALPVTEVVSKHEFFDYDAKYNGQVSEITPARISEALTHEVQRTTLHIYDTIDARGIIRVDYIISPDGTVQMLEVNTTPGMTATSFIPQQIRAAGQEVGDVLEEIIEGTIEGEKVIMNG